jgi:hypothetical protein
MVTITLDFPSDLLERIAYEASKLNLTMNEYMGMVLYDLKQACEADHSLLERLFSEQD